MSETIANPEVMTSEITNSCICLYCPTCECGTTGDLEDKCCDCNTDLKYLGECGGCWEDMHTDLDYVLDEWKERNGNLPYLVIYGTNMGWTHSASHTDPIEATAEQVLKTMSIDTEWRIIFTLNGKELSATRYSHDEYGAGFTFQPTATLGDED